MSLVSVSPDRLLTPAEVAELFAVDPKTVARWAKQGRLPCLKTLGGHRRYRWSDLEPYLAGEPVGQRVG
jgi:excisionase family DNA binding protein